MTTEIYDEETGITLKVLFTCGCGEQVVDLGNEIFECLHCDRVCGFTSCDHCATLMLVDNENYDEEDEDESDI